MSPLYSCTQDPHNQLRPCPLCDLRLVSVSLWASQGSSQRLDKAASPSAPGHNVQNALAGLEDPALFFSLHPKHCCS